MVGLEGSNALAKQVLSQALAGKYKVHRCGLPLIIFPKTVVALKCRFRQRNERPSVVRSSESAPDVT
jgi:hypothetical protein